MNCCKLPFCKKHTITVSLTPQKPNYVEEIIITLVSINLRLFPKVAVKEGSHCTSSRRRLDSLGLSGGFPSLEMVL